MFLLLTILDLNLHFQWGPNTVPDTRKNAKKFGGTLRK
jgi:hypothetical protein